MANPSAKARRPSRSSLHTRIFPSVATLKSRAWFLCLVSGNQLTCSKCHKLRITGTVTAAQPLQPAVTASTQHRSRARHQPGTKRASAGSWHSHRYRKEMHPVVRAESQLQFLLFTCPQFWDSIYGTFTFAQLQTTAFS